MATSRYVRSPVLDFGTNLGTSDATNVIRAAIKAGTLKTKDIIVRGNERLDTLAGVAYGDAKYWWILAASSDIGWGMQVPPGTIIRIPDLGNVLSLVG